MMDFNKIVIKLGDFGRFQLYICLLVFVLQVFAGIHMLANVFLMAEPKHRCYVDNCDTNNTHYSETFVNFTIPLELDEFGHSSQSQCSIFGRKVESSSCVSASFTNASVVCDKYVYDHENFKRTVVSKFDIVCAKSWIGASSQSIFMSGVLVGSFVFGLFSDRFGRKTGVLLTSGLLLCSSIGTAFSPNFGTFTALRFVTAATVASLSHISFVVAMEVIGTKYRAWYANSFQVAFSLGELLLALLAYYIRDWEYLELSLSLPILLLISYYWLFPESIRWLISKGRYSEAKTLILRAANWNNKIIPDYLLQQPEDTSREVLKTGVVKSSSSPLDLLKSRQLRIWSINLFFIWSVNSMVYYGLSLNAGNLFGNIYLNFALLAVSELPAVVLATFALNHLGRKWVLCITMLIAGLACASTVAIPQNLSWLAVTLAIVGKGAISASFAVIFIYTIEIYPTAARSTGLGTCSMFARVGSMLSPIINQLGKIYEFLPMIIFGTLSAIAGLLVLALPETHGKQLPEKIEEAEILGKYQVSKCKGQTLLIENP